MNEKKEKYIKIKKKEHMQRKKKERKKIYKNYTNF